MDDSVEDVEREDAFFRFCRTREESPHSDVICAGVRGVLFLAPLPVHGHADDCTGTQHGPGDPGRRVLPSHVDSIRIEATGELGVVIHEERRVAAVTQFPEPSRGFRTLLDGILAFVPQLNDRDASLEGRRDCREEARYRFLRRTDEIDTA